MSAKHGSERRGRCLGRCPGGVGMRQAHWVGGDHMKWAWWAGEWKSNGRISVINDDLVCIWVVHKIVMNSMDFAFRQSLV